jgi:hypothetical protein
MTTQTFSDVNVQRWQDIKQAIQAKLGLSITTDKSPGPIDYRGVKLEWALVGTDLSITIDSVSFGDKIVGQTEPVVMAEIATAIGGVQ